MWFRLIIILIRIIRNWTRLIKKYKSYTNNLIDRLVNIKRIQQLHCKQEYGSKINIKSKCNTRNNYKKSKYNTRNSYKR
jgi:hypothetical protein